jgi:hypothetical protein
VDSHCCWYESFFTLFDGLNRCYDVHRPISERDGRLHLLGWCTKGVTLHHPDGMTRALYYDADTTGDWQLLQEAVRALAKSGFTPLLEVSPVGPGGHLWIIYTSLVCEAWARRHVLELAFRLEDIAESWPDTGSRARKVRLPGGKYVQPGVSRWCTLCDAHGTLLATDGPSAARVLLDYQTPITLVPAYSSEPHRVGQRPERAALPNVMTSALQHQRDLGRVDSYWHYTSSCFLWFQFTPRQLAALYNERHPLSAMLQIEHNGMAFSPSVHERTPSTAITKDGRAWVDFSARIRALDGRHDGGDALELAACRNGETRAAKAGTMREIARELVRGAITTLEHAARTNELPPAWVASIMTEAGWQHYHRLRLERHGKIKATASPNGGWPLSSQSEP